MYLRITRGRFDPAKADQFVPLAREVNAAVQRLPGCQSMHMGVDRNAGRIAAVSTWDTEEHAQFSRETLGDVMTRIHALGTQLDPPEVYEVEV